MLVVVLAVAGARAATPDPELRLQVDALVQEGGLLHDEFERLRAPSQKLAAEGAELDAQEQSLRSASDALSRDIQEFNSALNELEKTARARESRCPRESQDAALVQACNAEAAEIRASAHQRDAQRPALAQRQRDLNASVEQHNAARQNWAARKSKHDALVELDRRDLGAWLERAQRYFATDGFRAAYGAAGQPAACRADSLRDLTAAPTETNLERALGCLQAL